ncbi:MAG: SOS response-associated peptidase family protein [Clostridia bacterium]|nr:SOS response-associated peptidase family protein [Clostridia bacterium]
MCGRYFIENKEDERIEAIVRAAVPFAEKAGRTMKSSGDVFPTDLVPVLAPSRLHRELIPFPMIWGFAHPNRPGVLVFNTRSETAEEKPLFVTSVHDRRCLIPVSGYYEWEKTAEGKKERRIFTAAEPFFLAGLYIRSEREPFPYFSILTMEAPEPIRAIHQRMPVIVTEQQKADWIGGVLPIAEASAWSVGKSGIVCSG